MKFSEAKLEFETRYYRWATSEWEREINESFPNLRLFKFGSFKHVHEFMQGLFKEDQILLAHSLLKRFHPNAVKQLGISATKEEIALRDRLDDFRNNSFIIEMEELQSKRRAGEKIKFISKANLRKAMVAKFKEMYGARCIKMEIGPEWDPLFDIKICGWVISTQLWFGRSESLIQYKHWLESETRVSHPQNPEITGPAMIISQSISLGDWLGVVSQTQWEHLFKEDVEPACDAVLRLCGRFFDVAPKLLKGLEFENITAN
jgi:hypothetical protein